MILIVIDFNLRIGPPMYKFLATPLLMRALTQWRRHPHEGVSLRVSYEASHYLISYEEYYANWWTWKMPSACIIAVIPCCRCNTSAYSFFFHINNVVTIYQDLFNGGTVTNYHYKWMGNDWASSQSWHNGQDKARTCCNSWNRTKHTRERYPLTSLSTSCA